MVYYLILIKWIWLALFQAYILLCTYSVSIDFVFAIVFHSISLECFHLHGVWCFFSLWFSSVRGCLLSYNHIYLWFTGTWKCVHTLNSHAKFMNTHVCKVTTLNDSTRFRFDFISLIRFNWSHTLLFTHTYNGKKRYKKIDGNLTENLHSNFCDRFACTTRYMCTNTHTYTHTQCTYKYDLIFFIRVFVAFPLAFVC